MEILTRLFDARGFVPRALCGEWTPALIWLHNASDFFIWTAYLAIPIVLMRFAYRRRHELPFRNLFWLFGVFIMACGTTHLMDIILFYNPVYRLAGVIKLITAAASWGTVLALIPIVPRALAMRSPEVLQREIEERERAEAEVRLLNVELENRVRERTQELEAANREKDRLLEDSETSNRMKDEFLAMLSHELRTPLNALTGWTHLLRSGQLDTETTLQALNAIENSAHIQTRLIEEILDVSRIVAGKMDIQKHQLNLNAIAADTAATLITAAQAKNLVLQTQFDDQQLLVQGDAIRLQQAVWHLLSNAIKFTPNGGTITLSTQRVNEHAQLVVRDNGSGIKPDFLPYVFESFRQADSSDTRAFGGMGLGLTLVQHIMVLHGGTVHAHSNGQGQGAEFTVALPVDESLNSTEA